MARPARRGECIAPNHGPYSIFPNRCEKSKRVCLPPVAFQFTNCSLPAVRLGRRPVSPAVALRFAAGCQAVFRDWTACLTDQSSLTQLANVSTIKTTDKTTERFALSVAGNPCRLASRQRFPSLTLQGLGYERSPSTDLAGLSGVS